jgi:AcrR family transcriptional regulator
MATSGIEARRKAALEDGNATYLARRQEIVQAASHVFRERGFEAATLRDVAMAMGTDRASLYYYVRSKEELLQEIVREVLGHDIEAAQAVRASKASGEQKIRALIESMVASYTTNYPHMNVYMEDLGRIARQDSEWSTDIIVRTRRYESIVHDILIEAREDGTLTTEISLELCALSLFGMINWMHRWYRPGIEWTPEQIAESCAAIFLNGNSAPSR